MPVLDGLSLLQELRKTDIAPPVILITAHPDMESAINALHNGAFDYRPNPFSRKCSCRKSTRRSPPTGSISEHAILTELVSLHEMTCRLTASNTLDDLLDAIFKVCVETVHAEQGSIHLYDLQTRSSTWCRRRPAPWPQRCTGPPVPIRRRSPRGCWPAVSPC